MGAKGAVGMPASANACFCVSLSWISASTLGDGWIRCPSRSSWIRVSVSMSSMSKVVTSQDSASSRSLAGSW